MTLVAIGSRGVSAFVISPVSRSIISVLTEHFAVLPREAKSDPEKHGFAAAAPSGCAARNTLASPAALPNFFCLEFGILAHFGARDKLTMSVCSLLKNFDQPALASKRVQRLRGLFISCPPYPRFRLRALLSKFV